MSTVPSRAVGQFAWDTTRDAWRWDVEMFEIHGYRGGAVPVVSTDLVLAHKHERHHAHAADLLEKSVTEDRRFSNYHGIVDALGQERTVLVVGESRTLLGRESGGRLARGFMVDVTPDEDDTFQRGVALARQGTAAIQQSAGLLMGSLGLTEEAAISVLKRVSSHYRVKMRELAQRFMAAAMSSAGDGTSPRDLSQLLIDQASELAVQHARARD